MWHRWIRADRGTALSKDGYGIVAGDPNARVHIELYTEPQCSHCADLQKDFGDDMARYINLGQLAITYRPLTFLDKKPGGYSDRVSNAMFLAPGPNTSGKAFQRFVQDLWGPPGFARQRTQRRSDRRHGPRERNSCPPGRRRDAGRQARLGRPGDGGHQLRIPL